MRLQASYISRFVGFFVMYAFFKVLQNKIKISFHIPFEKNGNIHGLKFFWIPPNLGTMCNFLIYQL